jgi:hypothetical protein
MSEHWGMALQEFTMFITWWCPSNWLILHILLILHQGLHELCLHRQELLNSQWRWWWWIRGNASMTPTSSSSGHLPSIINIQTLRFPSYQPLIKIKNKI